MNAPRPDRAIHNSPTKLRELAQQAARVGGAVARAEFGRRQSVSLKSDASEVTETDLAAERAVIEHVRKLRPFDRFIGEESVELTQESPANVPPPADVVTWIIDPIDGTRNFIRRMPLFTCSIAAVMYETIVAGAVYEPIPDTMYSAERGNGAFIDGKRTPLTTEPTEENSATKKLFVGIPSARRAVTRPLVLHAVERHIVRNFGSVALHLALTAIGRLDVTVVGAARLWDVAAGCLLVEEGGGKVTAPDGSPLFTEGVTACAEVEIPLIAASSRAHEQILREIRGE